MFFESFFFFKESGPQLFSIKSIDQSNMDDLNKLECESAQELAKSNTVSTNSVSEALASKTSSATNIENILVYNNSGDFTNLLKNFKKIDLDESNFDGTNNRDEMSTSKEKVTDSNGLNSNLIQK